MTELSQEKIMYRVVDSKTYRTIFTGRSEKECVSYVDTKQLNNVFVERFIQRKDKV